MTRHYDSEKDAYKEGKEKDTVRRAARGGEENGGEGRRGERRRGERRRGEKAVRKGALGKVRNG
jgi:hypothetical protein